MSDERKLDYATPAPRGPSAVERGLKALLAVVAIALGLLFLGLLSLTAFQ